MKNQACQTKHSQSGNVLIIVFIAIALFAALSYVLMKSSRSTGTISGEAAKLAATELITYANKYKEVYKTLRINGCQASQISFANIQYTDPIYYPDPVSAPTNKSCHIYERAGGALSYVDFKPRIITSGSFTGFSYASIIIEGIGSTANEITIVVPSVPDSVCTQLNLILNGEAKRYANNLFGGIINSGDNLTSVTCPECVGKSSGCAYHTTNNFYFTLEAN